MTCSTLYTLFVASLLATSISGRPAGAGDCQGSKSDLRFSHKPVLDSSLSAHVISNSLTHPRGLKFDSAWNLLVVDFGEGIVALTEASGDSSCRGWEKRTVLKNAELTHGIEVVGNHLYASTVDTLFRWNYDPEQATVSGNAVTIVTGMANPIHDTRTLQYQPGNPGYMIINRGSGEEDLDLGTADLSTGRAQIRRFALNGSSYTWNQGELLAWGVRNGCALALSQDGNTLWEVENSADGVRYNGADVHLNNPADELNLIDLSSPSSYGKFYGYPHCLTAWNMSADVPNLGNTFNLGDQFTTGANQTRDDAWCRNDANVVKPVLNFMAHSAPLDIKFYSAPSNRTYAINTGWNNDAFVSFHGSWNTDPPTGYGVVRIPWSTSSGRPQAPPSSGNGYSFILSMPDTKKCPSSCLRPVGLSFDNKGRLFVSSDTTKEVIVIESVNAPGASGSSRTVKASVVGVLASMVSVLFFIAI